MSLAAPAIAIANQSKPVGHTAPLLPTPPTVTSVLGAAGIVPTAPVSWREREKERERERPVMNIKPPQSDNTIQMTEWH